MTCNETLTMLCSDDVSNVNADLSDVVWASEPVDSVSDNPCKEDLDTVQCYPQKMHVNVPYVMLQLVNRLEPNHAMQISATSLLGMCYCCVSYSVLCTVCLLS